jgi:ribose transport system permease protein
MPSSHDRSLAFRWPVRYRVVWVALAALVVLCAVDAPRTLGSLSLAGVTALAGVLLLGASGQLLVIVIGGIDLSVPAVMTLAAAFVVKQTNGLNGHLGVALAEALAAAVLVGLINGVLVATARLNALIVTLAMNGVVAGGILLWTGTSFSASGSVPPRLAAIGGSSVGWVSDIAFAAVGCALVLAAVIRRTRVGRNYVAVGTNPVAAEIIGIPVMRYRIAGYVLGSVLYAVAGVLLAGHLHTPDLTIGSPYQLLSIVAVALSGASLAGGPASIAGLTAAAIFLPLLDQYLAIKGLSGGLQAVLQGVVLVAAVAVLKVGSLGLSKVSPKIPLLRRVHGQTRTT